MSVESILSDLIRIDTSNPPGNETAVANYLASLFSAHGIPHKIIEPVPGRGSFLSWLGQGPRRLLLVSHSDVVPAGGGWEVPPFSGETRNGYLWGRGAMDCKNLVAAEAWTMLELARHHPPLPGTLIFLAAADEENGGSMGMEYLCEHHAEELVADFSVNEGALEPVVANTKPLCFVQVGEKGVAHAVLTVRGKSAHGSTPALGENAVVKAATVLRALASYRPPVHLLPEVQHLMDRMAFYLDAPSPDAGSMDTFLGRVPDEGVRELLRALTRMTISPNVISGGTRVNVVPDVCQIQVDIRILPGQTRKNVEELLQHLLGPEVEIEISTFHAPTFSPAEGAAYQLICSTAKQASNAVDCLPCLSTGATDSRFLRELGIKAYGVSPLKPDFNPELRKTVHGCNERIDLDSLRLHAKFLHDLAVGYLSQV